MNQDVLGIFDANFRQVFASAHALKATITPTAKTPAHPLENGETVVDHVIFDPVLIEIAAVLDPDDYRDVYGRLARAFANAQTFNIQTRVQVYPNMLLQALPHEEKPEMVDTVSMVLKFSEVRFVTPSYAPLPAKKVANKTKASTTNRGQQAGGEPKASTGSVLSKILKAL